MCLVSGCEKDAKVKGMCSAHYQLIRRTGDLVHIGRGAKPKHGMKNSPTYKSWSHMKYRCKNPNCNKFKDYGGRGITVCERWETFENFLEDMGEKQRGQSIDRIDCNGNYEPGNCRWATSKTQCNNKRNNDVINYCDISMNLSQWADCFDIARTTLYNRLYTLGWSFKKSIGGVDEEACRAIVAAKSGDTVQVPKELLQ